MKTLRNLGIVVIGILGFVMLQSPASKVLWTNMESAVQTSLAELNILHGFLGTTLELNRAAVGAKSNVQAQADSIKIALSAKANKSDTISSAVLLNNTALTGVPTAPTAAVGTNTTQIATTAGVVAEIISKTKNSYGNDISNMAGYVMGTVFPVGFSGSSSSNNFTMISGRNYFCTIMLYKPTVVTGYKFSIVTAGVYTADAVNGLSIHSMALNLSTEVSGSQLTNADMWTVSGVNTKALTTPITLPAGEYKIYVLYHSSAQTIAPVLSGLTTYDIGNYTANSWGGNNALVGYIATQTTLSTTQQFLYSYTAISNVPLIELY